MEAAAHIARHEFAAAEAILRPYLKDQPGDVNAIRMLGEIGLELGALRDAENLLAQCVKLAPDYPAGRYSYANVLYKRHRFPEAIAQLDALLQVYPSNPAYLALKAANLAEISQHQQAIAIFSALLDDDPNNSSVRLSLGHAQRAIGDQAAAIQSYRKVAESSAEYGEACWSLANLKTYRFDDSDLETMREQLKANNGDYRKTYHLLFALAKALEDAKQYQEAMAALAQGNKLKSKTVPWSPEQFEHDTQTLIDFFQAERIQNLESSELHAADPIFIVGLPRAGSTLIEQILSSHSQVEGTAELANMIAIARSLANKTNRSSKSEYPEILEHLNEQELAALGKRYLDETRLQRQTQKPYFIDKMPNNFSHIGLIHQILPNAKVIDARRHPVDCCFSGYKQLFASGQGFTYSQRRIAHYYRQYERLMAHWDKVLPGFVYRVHYEAMVENPEHEIRALLTYCGLQFEDACIHFHETQRTVRTASSEQVRQPINRKGIGAWKPYEAWLQPMLNELGDSIANYPHS